VEVVEECREAVERRYAKAHVDHMASIVQRFTVIPPHTGAAAKPPQHRQVGGRGELRRWVNSEVSTEGGVGELLTDIVEQLPPCVGHGHGALGQKKRTSHPIGVSDAIS